MGVGEILPVLDTFLEEGEASELAATSVELRDHQREGAVVVLGTLAKHLDKEDPKVSRTVDTLIDALDTPSEAVQTAVAKCLPPLVKAVGAGISSEETRYPLFRESSNCL